MTPEFLSCVQTALLSASYDNIILKAKQIICLESLYLKKDLLAFLPTGYKKSRSICSCKIRKFAYSAPPVHEKEKILQCSKVICHFGKFVGWCMIYQVNSQTRSQRSLSSSMQYYFFRVLLTFSNTDAISWVIGSFSKDDSDGNQDVKKAIGLLCKTTTLNVHHAFLYISSRSLHDYNVKLPNCKFYGGRKQARTNLFFSI